VQTNIDTLIRIKEVLALTGLSRATYYDLRRRGEFPQAVSLTSRRAVAVRLSDVQAWIATRRPARG